MKRSILAAFWLLMTIPFAGGQDPDPVASKVAAANSIYQARDWPRAERLYEELVQMQPDNGMNWYRFGVCLQANGKHQQALDALQKAKDKGAPAPNVEYAFAAAYASMGQTELAMQRLTEAIQQGYGQPDRISTDPDLRAIRSDARFAPLLEKAKYNQSPCTFTPENRQFDFWIGDWNVVTTKDSSPAGTSHIERVIGDCVIWENWSSLNSSYMGKSYNTYNSNLKRWEQFWVDNVGGMIHFYGGFNNRVMDFYTDEMPQPDGTKIMRHLQFFNLGANKVRQFSQMSMDRGKTWTIEYDFTYNRKNDAP